MRNGQYILFNVIWISLLFGALHWVSERYTRINSQAGDFIVAPPFSTLDRRVLTILTLGRKSLYDDFLNLWMMQLYTNDADYLAKYRDQINSITVAATKLEPAIEGYYFIACLTSFKHLGNPTACKSIVDTGIRLFPRSFRLPMLQAYVELFELNQPAKAAAYYAIAATKPRAPEHVPKLVTRLLKLDVGLTNAELQNILQDVAVGYDDPVWKEIIQKKFEALNSGATSP